MIVTVTFHFILLTVTPGFAGSDSVLCLAMFSRLVIAVESPIIPEITKI